MKLSVEKVELREKNCVFHITMTHSDGKVYHLEFEGHVEELSAGPNNVPRLTFAGLNAAWSHNNREIGRYCHESGRLLLRH